MGRKLALTLVSIALLAIFGLGLMIAVDMLWRAAYTPSNSAMGADLAFFEYRDFIVTTQPANLVLGQTNLPQERVFPDADCRSSDGAKARFNSLGFRSPEFTHLPEKQANEVRIIVTGGSVSMSLSVNEECTLAANLQRMLTERMPGKTVKVFTLGSGAWKSFQQLIAVQRYGHDIAPDLVIAFDGFNDVTHSFTYDGHAPYATWWVSNAYGRLRDWELGGPLEALQGIRIVHDISAMLPSPSIAPASIQPSHDPRNQNAVDLYLRNARLLELAAVANKAQTLHVLQPMVFAKDRLSDEESKIARESAGIAEYSRLGYARVAAGLVTMTKDTDTSRFLDLSAPFQGDARSYFRDPCHMNAAAYRIVASRIADAAVDMLPTERSY